MARLPIPGSDDGTWGNVLNDFLSQAHNNDGTLKANAVDTNVIADSTITEGKLSGAVQTKLNSVAPVTSVNGQTAAVSLTKSDINLGNVDNTSDAAKNSASATLTNKTISGASNTLSNIPQSAVTNLTADLAAKADNSAAVHVAGNETIGGVKTFSSSPVVPTPAVGSEAANKTYVDSVVGGGGPVTWGGISGTLGDQTDLQSALDAKEDGIAAGTNGQYWRGDKSWQTLDKSAVGLGNVDNTSDAAKNSASATLTNKTISGASNTLSNIPESAITNLTTDLGNKVDTTTSVSGGTSLTGGGTLTTNRTITLVNDSTSPGNDKYYGTDGSGIKGYFDLPGAGTGSTTSGVLTVASSESPQSVKDACDYVCTGTNDQTVINQALLQASRAGDGFGGDGYIGVHLVGPTFYVANNGTTSITMYPSTHLFGSGPGTLIRPMWPTNVDRGAIELLDSTTGHVRVSNLSIGKINATSFNGHGIKFTGTGTGDQYELKTGNDPYCIIDHIMVLFAGKKGIYITGTSGGMRETQISHSILWNAAEEGILVDSSSDCQISDCRANGGGSYPRFSLSGGNSKIANCKAYYSGGSSNLNADGYQVSSSRCEVVGCAAQDNGRWGFNITSSSANISACTADSNSRLQSDGGGFLITNNCSAQGLVAFDRGQTPSSPQNQGIVFTGSPQVNVTGYVSVDSGSNHVVGAVGANSFARIVRNGTTLFSAG
jgi:hypothetical protein